MTNKTKTIRKGAEYTAIIEQLQTNPSPDEPLVVGAVEVVFTDQDPEVRAEIVEAIQDDLHIPRA